MKFYTVSRKHAKYSPSLLPLEPVANRGQVLKVLHQFTVKRSTLPAKRYIPSFKQIRVPPSPKCSVLPRPLCPGDTL